MRLPLLATPDQAVKVEEQVIGSNAEGYAILRTETDNLGSYYASRTKRYLDEYTKNAEAKEAEAAIGTRTRSALLLDTKTALDATAENPQTAKPTITVDGKDTTLLLADLLLKYPNPVQKWDDAKFRRLEIHQAGGIRLGRAEVLHGDAISREVFGDAELHGDWKLEEVLEDENCLYLRLTKGLPDGNANSASKMVCIPPRRSNKVKAHLNMESFYLITGAFATLEEARTRAIELVKKCKQAKYYGFRPEMWSTRDGRGVISYVIADPYAKEHISARSFPEFKEALGVEVTPRSSEQFEERFGLTE